MFVHLPFKSIKTIRRQSAGNEGSGMMCRGKGSIIARLAVAAAVAALALVGCGGDSNPGGGSGGKYKEVTIGSQTWMAENLNIKTNNSWCYGDKSSNCSKYGALYTWDDARGVCPSGWHLPTINEWDELINSTGDSATAGTKLKSKSWNGTDNLGFKALPGGYGIFASSTRLYYSAGSRGTWWTANSMPIGGISYGRMMDTDSAHVFDNTAFKDLHFHYSVRCVKD
jgi:uncharacterized protein (TIGR02145 family)